MGYIAHHCSRFVARMLAGSACSPNDDDEIRKGEKEFFAKLSEAPKQVDGLRYLISKHKGKILVEGATVEASDHSPRAGMAGSDDDSNQRETSEDDDDWRARKRFRKS